MEESVWKKKFKGCEDGCLGLDLGMKEDGLGFGMREGHSKEKKKDLFG